VSLVLSLGAKSVPVVWPECLSVVYLSFDAVFRLPQVLHMICPVE